MYYYKIAICDDNLIQTDIIEKYIVDICKNKKLSVRIFKFDLGKKLLDNIVEKNFEIVFLDINMPEMNGLKIAKKLKEINKDIIIVFLTGYKNYAVDAFEIRAFNYILKPVTREKFDKAFIESIDQINIKSSINNDRKYITVKSLDGYAKIYIDQIIYMEREKRQVKIVCEKNKTLCIYSTIKKLEEKNEDNKNIIKCNEGCLVNIDKVKFCKKTELELNNGYKLIVSRRCHTRVKDLFFERL